MLIRIFLQFKNNHANSNKYSTRKFYKKIIMTQRKLSEISMQYKIGTLPREGIVERNNYVSTLQELKGFRSFPEFHFLCC